jgi:tight adherence protein B
MFGFGSSSGLDMALIIPVIMAAGAFFLAIQAGLGVFTEARTQVLMNRRLKFKEKYDTTSEAMIELRKSRGLDDDGNFAMPIAWFNRLVTRSGLQFQPVKWAAMSFGGAGVVAIAYGVLRQDLWIALLIFVVLSIGAPLFVLRSNATKRMKKMAEQLPDALQIVCRSLEAGHPVATAVSLVAREMPDPIGTEFGMAADEVSYGASLTTAIQRMAMRAGDPDVELFAATVRLQEKTGGNLCDLLNANVTTVRERQIMRLKVKAASSEGRASAMILTSAPFLVMLAIHVLKPEFYGSVWHEPIIKYGFLGLGTWMFIGNMVMRKMINFKM